MTESITIHGGLTSAPELRYSNNGVPIASGTVASTERYLDRQTNEWRDGKSLYLRYTAFKDMAEHIAGSGLEKGSQVVVTGKLHTRSFDDREGNKRTVTELEATDFAVSLRRATVQVTRTASGGGNNAPSAPAPSDEPWTTPDASYGDDTPF